MKAREQNFPLSSVGARISFSGSSAFAVAFSAAGLGAAQGLTAAVVYGVLGTIACLPGLVVLLRPAPRPEVLPC